MKAQGKNFNLPIGPFHPLLEEAEYFKLKVEGEKVVGIEFETGWMHRGIEKICEQKTFDQALFTVERICGICSTSHPFACVNALEDIDKIEIPDRAKLIRVLIGELERLHSHLLWLGLAGHFIGYDTLWMWAWKYREPILELMESISGNRNHYAMMRVGGVRRDVDDALLPVIIRKLDPVKRKTAMIAKAAADDPVLKSRLKGVGVLSKEAAVDYGAVGPTARASGVAIDVRKDEPTAAYSMVDFRVITAKNGDVYDKLVVRLLENFESIRIIEQVVEKLKTVKGAFFTDVKEISPGQGIGRYEAPRGEVFHYIKTDGSNRPVRHKIRAPSYVNIPTFEASCIDQPLSDVLITTAAIDPCYCCTERTIKLVDDRNRPLKIDLLALSRRKTELLKNDCGKEGILW
ncbi:MAG: nickel-dependent hydrogenase large subunit [Bacillota bacterium]